jgi:hypothetical protein
MYNSGNSSKNVTGSAIVDGTVEAADLATAVNNDIADGVAGKATADLALPKAGGAMTGAITTNSTFDGRDVATDGAALDVLDLAINSAANAVAITIDASENVGIGTTSPDAQLDISASIGGTLRLSDTTGNTVADEAHGTIEFYTADIDGPRVGSYIKATSQDTFGRLSHLHFAVSRSVNATATEVMRVTSNGLTFNGDTAAANALDDYEEGTWTPAFSYATNAVITTSSGRYTKIGNMIWCDIKMSGISMDADASDVHITLPFAVGTDNPMSINEGKDFSFLNALNIQGAQVINSTEFKIFTADNNPITYNETTRAGTLELAIMVRV